MRSAGESRYTTTRDLTHLRKCERIGKTRDAFGGIGTQPWVGPQALPSARTRLRGWAMKGK